jgi:hypothetical protein
MSKTLKRHLISWIRIFLATFFTTMWTSIALISQATTQDQLKLAMFCALLSAWTAWVNAVFKVYHESLIKEFKK